MKKYLLYILLAFIALPFAACSNDDEPAVEGEVTEREFMTMFRRDFNTNKGDDEPYACKVEALNDIHLYWYGVHDCAGYQIQASISGNVTGGSQAWADTAANGLLVLDTIVGPEVLDLVVKDLEYSTDYRFAIRTLSKKGEGYHSKWYGHGDGRHWADWFGLTTGDRYLYPLLVQIGSITKTSFRISLDRAYATAGDDDFGTMKEHFEIDADGNFVVHYLTITPSPTNPNAKIDAKWAHYDLTAEDFERGYVEVEGLDENSVYVVNAVNKNNPVFVDAVYNTCTPRTDGTPGDPIHLKWDDLYIPNDSVPGANDYEAARLDEWLVNYTSDATLAEGTIFYLDGGKNYYFHANPILCKGFTLATNPEDLAAGKGNASVFLGGTTVVGSTPNSCNFMFGRTPQAGEGAAEINVKSLVFENINFDCPTAKNFGDGAGTGNYFANMYSTGMGVVFSSIEVRNCTFQRMVRGFIRVQGSKRKVFENLIVENCVFANCGWYDNDGRSYAWIAGDGNYLKSNIFTNAVFRGNTFYDSPRRAIFFDNNKSLTWPENIQYRMTLENNTFLNYSTRRQDGCYLFEMRYLPSGSVITVRNNLFVQSCAADDNRTLYFHGMDIRQINGAAQAVEFNIENNYCSTSETNRQKDDGIFYGGAFSATKNSAAKYENYKTLSGGPSLVKGKDALTVKHTKSAAGDILDPTEIFVNPNPPHKNGDTDMHERDLEDVLNGMKFKNTPEVTGAEFYQKKVGDPRWY